MSELNEDDILMLDDGELFVTKVSYDALRAELEQAQADVKKWITHFEKEAARHDETIASVARLRAALEDLVSALEDGDSIFRQVSKAKAALERAP